jgi:integrative and conjugative element protein (TIGR02256 family)
MMPHNAARHALDGHFIGCNKAEALAFVGNSIIGDEQLFSALPLDVIGADAKHEELSKGLREADAILDVSTSVAVARTLVYDVDSSARRISLFMTPSGQDLVLIAEDKERKLKLDALEMQYYRAAMNEQTLEGHFGKNEPHRRYGQSCNDITSTLPQHLVALHAAIGATALREILRNHDSVLAVWRADNAGNVRRITLPTWPIILQKAGSWTIVIDHGLLHKLSSMRKEKLPNETGGVLLGSFDVQRSILYIVDALPSPPDSEEWPTLYIRGSKGLRQLVDRFQEVTHGMIEYVGEWHSHPKGANTGASLDDLEVFAWLTELMETEGLPAVMMIVGDPGRTSCFVGEIKTEENLLQGVPL